MRGRCASDKNIMDSVMEKCVQQFVLSGRIALFSGSSAGIGLALARGLAAAGAVVALSGRDEGKLSRAAAKLASEGHAVHMAGFDATSGFDASSDASIAPAIEKIESRIGPIGILFNNAGIQRRAPLETFAEQD